MADSSSCKVLVSAPNGRTGRQVVKALRQRQPGLWIRGLSRSDAAHVDESMIGDLEDPSARARATEGIDIVIHYGPAMHPRETAMGTGMIDAAVAARVSRFVYISVIHPQIDDLLNHKAKLAVEAHLINSGIRWTIMRPQHYMQTVDIRRAVAQGGVFLPYPPTTRLGHVDMVDVATAVARVALEHGHDYASYDLSTDEAPTFAELCATIARLAGAPVEANTVELATILSQVEAHWTGDFTSYTREGFARLLGYYSRNGIFGNAAHLRQLLGREPSGFEDFARRTLAEDLT